MDHKIKDTGSQEWLRVKDYCKTRLVELRSQNEGDLNKVETADIRGMIRFAREILDMDKTEQSIKTYTEDYSG